jgi:phosphohistidine phosphatase
MIIYLVRHAMADPATPDQADADREVSKQGQDKLKSTVDLFAAKKVNKLDPTLIISSPIVRSMQTATIIAGEVGYDPAKIVQEPELAPDGDAAKAFANMKDLATSDSDQVMMVGSNPVITALGQIIHGLGTKAGQSGAIRFKKAAMVRFDVNALNGKYPSAELMNIVSPGIAEAAKKL